MTDKERARYIASLNAKRNAEHAEMVKQPIGEYYKKFIKGRGKNGKEGSEGNSQRDESPLVD